MDKLKNLTLLIGLILLANLTSCFNSNNNQKKTSTPKEVQKPETKYIGEITAASLYEPLKNKGFKVDK